MNARTLLALLVAMAISGSSFAETETEDPAAAETAVDASPEGSLLASASASASSQFEPGELLSPPDFRNVRITDGTFQERSTVAFKIFGASMFIAAGADLASTEYSLGRPGLYEANPLQHNRTVRVLSHAAVPAFMYFVTEKLHDRGKPKLALLARIGFTVGYSYIVMHNLRTAALTP